MECNIDFIKWMCEKAEDWTYKKNCMIKSLGYRDTIKSPDGNVMCDEDFESKDWKVLYLPLLLQRAIEGVNREHTCGFKIDISDNDIVIKEYITGAVDEVYLIKEIDQTKEAALKYIYEQEIK